MKTIDEAIAIIRARIEGCEQNDTRALQRYAKATDDNGRERESETMRIANAQRLILESTLKEIMETESD